MRDANPRSSDARSRAVSARRAGPDPARAAADRAARAGARAGRAGFAAQVRSAGEAAEGREAARSDPRFSGERLQSCADASHVW
ncbi:MAG: hypothetical protein DMF56_01735 [Acidobacteria bacterium]|nr:MAG: hypothetical protein DMF56_01735 [Acidobacteriota bacterium]